MTQPFHFPNGRAANDAKDLLELCEQYPDEATGFLVRHDLENWLAYIGSYDIAECAANARQVDAGDRQKLEDFLNKCHSLTSSQPTPAAVTSTNIKDNFTPPDTADITKTEVATVLETPFQGVSVKEAVPPQPATPAAKSAAQPAFETPASSSSTNSAEKPSFFQVVAKFLVKILYRDKA